MQRSFEIGSFSRVGLPWSWGVLPAWPAHPSCPWAAWGGISCPRRSRSAAASPPAPCPWTQWPPWWAGSGCGKSPPPKGGPPPGARLERRAPNPQWAFGPRHWLWPHRWGSFRQQGMWWCWGAWCCCWAGKNCCCTAGNCCCTERKEGQGEVSLLQLFEATVVEVEGRDIAVAAVYCCSSLKQ